MPTAVTQEQLRQALARVKQTSIASRTAFVRIPRTLNDFAGRTSRNFNEFARRNKREIARLDRRSRARAISACSVLFSPAATTAKVTLRCSSSQWTSSPSRPSAPAALPERRHLAASSAPTARLVLALAVAGGLK